MKSVIKAPTDFRVIQRQLISLLNDEIACREGCCSDGDKRRSLPGGKPMAEFVEGKRPVLEALKANIPAKCLYVAAVTRAERLLGISMPEAPTISAERAIAPKLPASVI